MRKWQSLTVGEVLDRALTLFRSRPWPYLVMGAFGMLPFIVISEAAKSLSPNLIVAGKLGVSATNLWTVAGALLASFLLFYPLSTGTIVALASGDFQGQPLTLGQAIRLALRRTPKLWVTYLCKGLTILGMTVGVATVGVLLALPVTLLGSARGSLAVATAVAAVVAVVILGGMVGVIIIHSLTTPAVLLEDRWHFLALGRSFSLSFYKLFRFLWLMAVAFLMRFPIAGLPSLLTTGLMYLGISLRLPWLVIILSSLIQVLVFPISDLVVTVAFFDLRVRKEAWDIEQTLVALEGSALDA